MIFENLKIKRCTQCEFCFYPTEHPNRQCRSVHPASAGNLIPNFRMGLATATSTEGLWMIGGLTKAGADRPEKPNHERFGQQTAGCTNFAIYSDVWVFNPRGWSRDQILGDAVGKYTGLADEKILPKRYGYNDQIQEESSSLIQVDQTFADFRLSDTPGPNEITITSALAAGWECTGVEGKWCRKPFLPRESKGAEATVMCFEPDTGTEKYYSRSNWHSVNTNWNYRKDIPRRPRVCNPNDTLEPSNDCICYLINISGQQGGKLSY